MAEKITFEREGYSKALDKMQNELKGLLAKESVRSAEIDGALVEVRRLANGLGEVASSLNKVNPGEVALRLDSTSFVSYESEFKAIPKLRGMVRKTAEGAMESIKRPVEPYILPLDDEEKTAYQRLRILKEAAIA